MEQISSDLYEGLEAHINSDPTLKKVSHKYRRLREKCELEKLWRQTSMLFSDRQVRDGGASVKL